jgi:hypothetical protein
MNQFGRVAAFYPVLIGVCAVRGAPRTAHTPIRTDYFNNHNFSKAQQ